MAEYKINSAINNGYPYLTSDLFLPLELQEPIHIMIDNKPVAEYKLDNDINNGYPYLPSDLLLPLELQEPIHIMIDNKPVANYKLDESIEDGYPYIIMPWNIKLLNIGNNNIQLLMAAFHPKHLTIINDELYPDDIVWPDDTLYPID